MVEFVKKALALCLPLLYVSTLSYAFLRGLINADVYIGAVGVPIVVVIIYALFRREGEKEEA